MAGWPTGRARDGGIDRIPLPAIEDGVGGALWLCGKHAVGPDPEAALGRVGASTVICLTERHELVDRYPHYVAWLEANRPIRAEWFPIPDLHAPAVDDAADIVERLRARLLGGEHLLVHCAAGIGRAGTIATCVLVSFGLGADDALAVVADHRPMAGPEVGAQLDLVRAFAARPRPSTPTGTSRCVDSIEEGA